MLSEAQMRQIAIAGVSATAPKALKYRSFGFERSNDHGYAYFEAMVNVEEGHVGLYVIDPQTGDMWDGVSECGEITSSEIRRLQRKVRQSISLSTTDYAKVRRRGPMCDQLPK